MLHIVNGGIGVGDLNHHMLCNLLHGEVSQCTADAELSKIQMQLPSQYHRTPSHPPSIVAPFNGRSILTSISFILQLKRCLHHFHSDEKEAEPC